LGPGLTPLGYAGLLRYRELNDALALMAIAEQHPD